MKKIFSVLFWLALLVGVYFYRVQILDYIDKYLFPMPEVIIEDKNEMAGNYDFSFVQITDDFYVGNKQEIMNAIYTMLDSGWNNFTFYCEEDYENCLSNLDEIVNDKALLNHINNFVHPFNSFSFFETVVSTSNNATVKISTSKLYNSDEISAIDKKADEVIDEVITDDMSDISKLRAVHDYIIKNSIYDDDFDPLITSNKFKANIAYGPLIEGYGICGGYSDAFAVFLDKLELKSYKIASQNHVWNYVYIADDWYHFDLTWDDPVMSDGSNALYHNHFMIDTSKLLEIDVTEHTFDKDVYIEAQ